MPRPARRITESHAGFGVFLAFLVIPLSGLATDIYLPSLPAMAQGLGSTPHEIQLSLTLFLIGYSLGQLFLGNVMDSHGRYPSLLIALLLFGVSSELIALTDNIAVLNALRLLQGALAAIAAVSKRTFFVDVFSGATLRRYLSSVTIVWSMGPIVAPFIGGLLQTHLGWRANFHFLAIYAWAVLALELWRGGETLRQAQPFHLGSILRRYRAMVTHGPFVRGILNVGVPYSSVLAFSMVSPFIIEHVYGQSPQVTGMASLAMGLAWMTGGFVARAQLHRTLLDKHAKAGMLMVLTALLMLGVSGADGNLYTLVGFAFVIQAACGLVFNIYFAECLGMFPQFAALSGGLTGGVAFMLTSVLSASAVTLLQVDSQSRLALVYLGFALMLMLTLAWGWRVRSHRRP